MNKLKQWKQSSGLKWVEIAKQCGISESTFHKIIAGKTDGLQVKTVIAIKKVTGLDYWEYINLEPLNKLGKNK